VDKLKSEKRSGKNAQDDLDALFELPLSEFTAARNSLATRLKKAGNAADANRVKSLVKPSVPAWAVNQLYRQHRIAFDRLLDAGERFRKAQTAQLAGKSADLRAPLEARRAALSELSTYAAKILAEGGSAATPDTMRRVTTTLEALSTYAGIPDTPLPGRLTDDVQPPGFEALAALVPRVGSDRAGGPTRVIPFEFKQLSRKTATRKATDPVDEKARAAERKAQIAAARSAIQEAEQTLRNARKAAQKAEEELKKAAGRAKEADAEKQKLEQQFEKLTAQADEARKNARAVAAAAEGAAQEVEDAERALDKARRALASLSDE
jgi:valyl-tRNA synthetase